MHDYVPEQISKIMGFLLITLLFYSARTCGATNKQTNKQSVDNAKHCGYILKRKVNIDENCLLGPVHVIAKLRRQGAAM